MSNDSWSTPDAVTPPAPTLPEPRRYRPDEPCAHPGCLAHHTHPCEGCGRIAGRYPAEPRPDDEGRELRARALSLANMIRGALLDADPVRGNATLAKIPALTPHPAPLGATDEGLRAAVERIRNLAAFTRHQATQQTGQNARDIRDDADAMDVLLRAALQATP